MLETVADDIEYIKMYLIPALEINIKSLWHIPPWLSSLTEIYIYVK